MSFTAICHRYGFDPSSRLLAKINECTGAENQRMLDLSQLTLE